MQVYQGGLDSRDIKADQGVMRALRGLLALIDLVMPPRCPVSGEIVGVQGMLAPAAWNELRFLADPYCAACGHPFDFVYEFTDEGGALCGACQQESPPYAAARSAIVYDDAGREMLLKFKHADFTQAVHSFVPWMERAGGELLARADMIVPVPLHRWRLLKRRYNQAALLARALAQRSIKPYVVDLLVRSRATPSQGHMGFRERQKNVQRAFAVNPKRAQAAVGKSILLIDDVYTTGATVKECVKVLMKAGAAEVNVLTVARVTKQD